MQPVPAWYYSDNGFPSVEEMDDAHQPIVALATAVLSGTGGNILDLGCGNGILLKKIHEAQPTSVPFGIDVTPSRIGQAFAQEFDGQRGGWAGGRLVAAPATQRNSMDRVCRRRCVVRRHGGSAAAGRRG